MTDLKLVDNDILIAIGMLVVSRTNEAKGLTKEPLAWDTVGERVRHREPKILKDTCNLAVWLLNNYTTEFVRLVRKNDEDLQQLQQGSKEGNQ